VIARVLLRGTLALAFGALALMKLSSAPSAEPGPLAAWTLPIALLEAVLAIGFLFAPLLPTALGALAFSFGAIGMVLLAPQEACACFGGWLPEHALSRAAVAASISALASFAVAVELRERREE
jgi:hypothetical protein